MLFQLGLKALEQREGVCCGAGKAGQHFAVMELAHFAGGAFDDDVAERDLAVAAEGDLPAFRSLAAHAENGGAVKLLHAARNGGRQAFHKGRREGGDSSGKPAHAPPWDARRTG